MEPRLSHAIPGLPRVPSKPSKYYVNTACLLTALTQRPLQRPVPASG